MLSNLPKTMVPVVEVSSWRDELRYRLEAAAMDAEHEMDCGHYSLAGFLAILLHDLLVW